jgi:hypothetical protein
VRRRECGLGFAEQSERGSVVVFVVVWTMTVLVGAGLLYDGGLILAAQRRAFDVAESAARAGAQEVIPESLRATEGQVQLDPEKVEARVAQYLATTGYRGTASVQGGVVTVRVRIVQPVSLLSLVNFGPAEVVGTGSSRPVPGITRGGD